MYERTRYLIVISKSMMYEIFILFVFSSWNKLPIHISAPKTGKPNLVQESSNARICLSSVLACCVGVFPWSQAAVLGLRASSHSWSSLRDWHAILWGKAATQRHNQQSSSPILQMYLSILSKHGRSDTYLGLGMCTSLCSEHSIHCIS